jgi:hypothetical protein
MQGKTLKAAFELTNPVSLSRYHLFERQALYKSAEDFLGDGLSAQSDRYCQSAWIEPIGNVTPDAHSLVGAACPAEPSLHSENVDVGPFAVGSARPPEATKHRKLPSQLAPAGTPVTSPDTLGETRCLEAFVVPGSRLLGINGKSNPALDARCRCIAKEFFQGTRQDQKIVVLIGGPVVVGRNAPSEAAVMRKIIVELGVPDGQIYTEPTARNTFESAVIAKNILKQLCIRIVRVVATDVHINRALIVFQRILGPEFSIFACLDPWTFASPEERRAEEKKEQYLLENFETHLRGLKLNVQ